MVNLDAFIPFLPKPNPEPTKPERKVQEVQKIPALDKIQVHPDAVAETDDNRQQRRERRDRRKKRHRGEKLRYYDRSGHDIEAGDDGDGDLDIFA